MEDSKQTAETTKQKETACLQELIEVWRKHDCILTVRVSRNKPKVQNQEFRPPMTDEQRAALDAPKPENLTAEQSKRWDDLDHDRQLLIKKGVFANGFRIYSKT